MEPASPRNVFATYSSGFRGAPIHQTNDLSWALEMRHVPSYKRYDGQRMLISSLLSVQTDKSTGYLTPHFYRLLHDSKPSEPAGAVKHLTPLQGWRCALRRIMTIPWPVRILDVNGQGAYRQVAVLKPP